MKKLMVLMILVLLMSSGCQSVTKSNEIKIIEYGIPFDKAVTIEEFEKVIENNYNPLKLGVHSYQIQRQNGSIIEYYLKVVDTKMPVFIKKTKTILIEDENYDIGKDFEASDVIDGKLKVYIVEMDDKKAIIKALDNNGNEIVETVEVKLGNKLRELSELKVQQIINDKLIEKPKPIEQPTEDK